MAKRGRQRIVTRVPETVTPEMMDRWADEIIAKRKPNGGKRERRKMKPEMLEKRQ